MAFHEHPAPRIELSGAPDERLVRLLAARVNEFNLEATGIGHARQLLAVHTTEDGELTAGVRGWSWGGTCWIESLWVRRDAYPAGHSFVQMRKPLS